MVFTVMPSTARRIRGSKSKRASAFSMKDSFGFVRGCLGVKTVQQSS